MDLVFTGAGNKGQGSEGPVGGPPLQNVRELWNRLKDDVTLPLLAALARAAGQEPPLGLLALPTEIKELCMSFLPVSTC